MEIEVSTLRNTGLGLITSMQVFLYWMHGNKKKKKLKWLFLCRFFYLSLSTFFSYILADGNFITSKIKKKECSWIKVNQCHLLHGQYMQCYWNIIWNLKLRLSVYYLTCFLVQILLSKINILIKSKLKDSVKKNPFWNKIGEWSKIKHITGLLKWRCR